MKIRRFNESISNTENFFLDGPRYINGQKILFYITDRNNRFRATVLKDDGGRYINIEPIHIKRKSGDIEEIKIVDKTFILSDEPTDIETYSSSRKFNETILSHSDHRKAKFAIRKNLDFMKEMEQVFYNHGEVMDLSIINEAYSELENLNEDELLEIYESVSSNVGPSYDNNTLKDSVILKLLEYFGY